MVCAKDYIKQAGQILDEIISIDCRNGYLSVSWTSKEIEIVEDLLKKAIALEPNNPSYQYCLQQLKIARGLGKSGYEGIRELNNLYPEYIEATGFMSNPEKWLSPFLYPSWNKCSNQADKSFSRLPSGGLLNNDETRCRPLQNSRQESSGFCALPAKRRIDESGLPCFF